jgi:hypothetical protein
MKLIKYAARALSHVSVGNLGTEMVDVVRPTRLLSDGTGSYFIGVRRP